MMTEPVRIRAVAWTTIANWLSRLTAAVAQLAVLRVVGNALGIDGLAIFITVIGLWPWFMLADIGLGQAVQNRVAVLIAQGRSTHDLLAGIGTAAILAILTMVLAWWFVAPAFTQMIFSALPHHSPAALLLAVRLAGVCMVVTAIGNIAFRVWFGEGRGWMSSLCTAAALLAGWLAVIIAVQFHAGIVVVLAAWLGPPMVMAIIVMLILLSRFGIAGLHQGIDRSLWRFSWHSWGFMLAATVTLNLDYVLLARVGDAQAITVYGGLQRLLAFIISLHAATMAAVAPALTASYTSGDSIGLRSMIRTRICLGMVMAMGLVMGLLIAGPTLVRLLVGHALDIGFLSCALASAYLLARIWTDTFSAALLALGRVKELLLMIPFQAMIAVVGMAMLAHPFGASGIFMALLASFMATAVWMLPRALRRQLSGMKSIA